MATPLFACPLLNEQDKMAQTPYQPFVTQLQPETDK